MTVCKRDDCVAPAVCVFGITLYPPAAVMKFYKTDRPLTRLILGLEVCQAHFDEVKSPFDLMPRDKLLPLARVCEQSSSTAVDLEASKLVAVSLDDPEYLLLLKQRKG